MINLIDASDQRSFSISSKRKVISACARLRPVRIS